MSTIECCQHCGATIDPPKAGDFVLIPRAQHEALMAAAKALRICLPGLGPVCAAEYEIGRKALAALRAAVTQADSVRDD